MKKIFLYIFLSCIIVYSEESILILKESTIDIPSVKFENDTKTKRMYIGKTENPESVDTSTLIIEWKGLYINLFSINNLTDYHEEENVDSFDFEKFEYTIGYKFSIKEYNFDAYYKYNDLQHDMYNYDPKSPRNEISLKISYECLLNPGIRIIYDTKYDYLTTTFILNENYNFLNLVEFKNELYLNLLNSKYNKKEFNVDKTTFSSIYYKLFIEYKYNESTYMGPLIEIGFPLSNEIKKQWEKNDINNNFNFLIGFKIIKYY